MEQATTNERTVFTFMVLTHEKLLKPYMDHFRETLSPMQLSVLGLLEAYGMMSMTELSEKLHTTRQQMTQIVARLFDIGVVERHPDERDRRLIKIRPTEKAQALLTEGARSFVREVLGMAGRLGEDEQQLLRAMETANRILPRLTNGAVESGGSSCIPGE
ncbi:MAG: MarR family transcriptional regulator [Provencibacterium sp.]|jgi:DNA-binding MarR family transcriptional regulator|nr:MarR family transcriptional regulator [Provencibacterium sp.]